MDIKGAYRGTLLFIFSMIGQSIKHSYCTKMKHIILCIFLALITLPMDAHAAERKYAIGNFENIQISGDLIINVTTDGFTSAKAKGSRRQLDTLDFNRNGRTLKISSSRSNITKRTQDKRSPPLEIFISTKRLKDIIIRGNASVIVTKVQSKQTKFLILGSGLIDVQDAKIENLNINIQGSGSVNIGNGTITKSDFSINGSGTIKAAGLTSEKATIVHQGPATTVLKVSKVADIDNNGAGRIEILGKANCIIKSIGSGQILCDNNQ